MNNEILTRYEILTRPNQHPARAEMARPCVCFTPAAAPQTTTSGISKYAIYIETIHVAHPFQLRFRFTSALPVPTTAQRSAHGQWPRASPPPPPQSPRSQSSANERKSSATSRSPSAVPGRSWEVMEDRISATFRSVRPRCSRAFLYLSIHLSIHPSIYPSIYLSIDHLCLGPSTLH